VLPEELVEAVSLVGVQLFLQVLVAFRELPLPDEVVHRGLVEAVQHRSVGKPLEHPLELQQVGAQKAHSGQAPRAEQRPHHERQLLHLRGGAPVPTGEADDGVNGHVGVVEELQLLAAVLQLAVVDGEPQRLVKALHPDKGVHAASAASAASPAPTLASRSSSQ
jgi:hypothetical protein